MPLSVSNFRCSHHSYITFLKHLEPKDFRSHFLLMCCLFLGFFAVVCLFVVFGVFFDEGKDACWNTEG